MSSSAFAFALAQRVNVPGQSDCSGVIVSRLESLDSKPFYSLSWTAANGRNQIGSFTEGELKESNWPRLTPESEPHDPALTFTSLGRVTNKSPEPIHIEPVSRLRKTGRENKRKWVSSSHLLSPSACRSSSR